MNVELNPEKMQEIYNTSREHLFICLFVSFDGSLDHCKEWLAKAGASKKQVSEFYEWSKGAMDWYNKATLQLLTKNYIKRLFQTMEFGTDQMAMQAMKEIRILKEEGFLLHNNTLLSKIRKGKL